MIATWLRRWWKEPTASPPEVKRSAKVISPRKSSHHRHGFRPLLEELENRIVPAPLISTTMAILPGFDTYSMGRNDDSSSGLIPLNLSEQINFFGTHYQSVYVNNNGNLTFDSPQGTFTPFGLTQPGPAIIAPFFADVYTYPSNSGVTSWGYGKVDGHDAFGVTWPNVNYYADYSGSNQNTFQVILIDRPDTGTGNFDIEFNYGQIQWETGSASGGYGGLGGNPVHIGYSNGTGQPGTYLELPGSGVAGAFLDSNLSTGLIHQSYSPATGLVHQTDTYVPGSVWGRYVFEARAGSIVTGDIVHVTPVVHVSDEGGEYNGNPYVANASVTGVEGVTPTVTYYAGTEIDPGHPLEAAPANVGIYTVVASIAGTDQYASVSVSAVFEITQAHPRVEVQDAGGTFDGFAFPAIATVAGVDGIAQSSLEGMTPTLTYYAGDIIPQSSDTTDTSISASNTLADTSPTPLPGIPVSPGIYTVQASFAGSTNYVSATAWTTFEIKPAPVINTNTDGNLTSGKTFAPGENGTIATTDSSAIASVIQTGNGAPVHVLVEHYESDPSAGSSPDTFKAGNQTMINTGSGLAVEKVSYDLQVLGAHPGVAIIAQFKIPQDAHIPALFYRNPNRADMQQYLRVPDSMFKIGYDANGKPAVFVVTFRDDPNVHPNIYDLTGTIFTITDMPSLAPVMNTLVTVNFLAQNPGNNDDVLGGLLNSEENSGGGRLISVVAPTNVTQNYLLAPGRDREGQEGESGSQRQELMRMLDSLYLQFQHLVTPQLQLISQELISLQTFSVNAPSPAAEEALEELATQTPLLPGSPEVPVAISASAQLPAITRPDMGQTVELSPLADGVAPHAPTFLSAILDHAWWSAVALAAVPSLFSMERDPGKQHHNDRLYASKNAK